MVNSYKLIISGGTLHYSMLIIKREALNLGLSNAWMVGVAYTGVQILVKLLRRIVSLSLLV
jgi:hypothetical protein